MSIVLILIIVLLYSKIIVDIINIRTTIKGLSKELDLTEEKTKINILIIIPVLREQNIIIGTLQHFKNLKCENLNLIICVAGTSREKRTVIKDGKTTGEIVNEWIEGEKTRESLKYKYVEVNEQKGDRATQLNYAVKEIGSIFKPDIIGVYDADSLPDSRTLKEVTARWHTNKNTVFQQPAHFIMAANRMASMRKNPILVANALYQTTWTVVREYPTWFSHHEFCLKKPGKLFYRNDYLIGHGEFIPYSIYKKYYFPEQQITDGIQLGYRLSMSGVDICALNTFCNDDVPQSMRQLIEQHKRWFGGCNRLKESYNWCRLNIGIASLLQVLDGYWSQISWAYAGIVGLLGVFLSVLSFNESNWILSVINCTGLLIYCYVIPYVSHLVLPTKVNVRLIDWLCLPIAIFVKGIGPNLYFVSKIKTLFSGEEIQYSKVER